MDIAPSSNRVEIVPLGQAGFRLALGTLTLYIDPYLSNGVEVAEGPDLRRQVPIWKAPEHVDDANWVLVTHEHIDHCDLATLVPLAKASAKCRFLSPKIVGKMLIAHGISADRIVQATDDWVTLHAEVKVHPVPAAHPEIEVDPRGCSRYVGYVIDFRGKRIYHSGDTQLKTEIIEAACAFKPIDVAILPVNERNHYRESLGIIGNMTVREAFQFATDLEVKTLIPMHWDMFSLNSVYPEEIELYTRLAQPPFSVVLKPTHI